MEEGNSSEDEITVPEHNSLTEDIETQVKHFFFFFLEKTSKNNEGIGQWQHGQLITFKAVANHELHSYGASKTRISRDSGNECYAGFGLSGHGPS